MQNPIDIVNILSTLEEIKDQVCQKFDFVFSQSSGIKVQNKEDNSLVTELDFYVSDLIKTNFKSKYESLNFFSEEDQEKFEFPMIILDPIDGTKELAKGINECAISFGIYFSEKFDDSRNFSWIFNPFTGFELYTKKTVGLQKRVLNKRLLSYVSRTEFDKGLHSDNEKVVFLPKGSIAYKLGLLASGAGDFVISKRPKNIWDIMAGTHLCFSKGIYLFQNGKRKTSLKEMTLENDLVWASDDVWNAIKDQL